jgi:hypothetical protein
MSKYTAFDPQSQVIGQSTLAFVQCVNSDEIRPFLAKHGFSQIEPDQWYPLQAWLDVLSDISTQGTNAMFDFVSVGMKISELALLPPQMFQMPFEEAFLQFSTSGYYMNHRGNVGEVSIERVSPGHLRTTLRTPYPDDFLYGIQYGAARRFMPQAQPFTLEYDPNLPSREQGGETTVLHLICY